MRDTMERLQEKFSVLESKIADVRARLEIADTLAERARDLLALDAQRIDTRRAKAELAEALAQWDGSMDHEPASYREEAPHA